MLSLEEAQARVLEAIHPLQSEIVSYPDALGRIAAEEITAGVDLPVFDNSAMDGFAVRAEDVRDANATNPVRLKLITTIPAGQKSSAAVGAETAARIFTGSPLPSGADAIVMQEDTRFSDGAVEILDAVKPWENVRLRGEDVKRGELLVHFGDTLDVGRITVAAATGTGIFRVGRRPKIALLSTGNELCDPGAPLTEGKIYESNRAMLAHLVSEAGAEVQQFPLVPDRLETTRDALARAFDEADAVITTGGVSVGELDFVKSAFEEIGGALNFWRVAIRPGKPFVFGTRGEKFLFGLPGNPVSAFVTFLLLVRPAILKWQGATDLQLPRSLAILGEDMRNMTDRRHFMRVNVDENGIAHSSGAQSSHMLGSLARANALLELPSGAKMEKGERVTVLRWSHC